MTTIAEDVYNGELEPAAVDPGDLVWERIKNYVYGAVGVLSLALAASGRYRPWLLVAIWSVLVVPIFLAGVWAALGSLPMKGAAAALGVAHFALMALLIPMLADERYILAGLIASAELAASVPVQTRMLKLARARLPE